MKVAMLNNPVVVVNPEMCGGVERMSLLELDALEPLGVEIKYYVRGFIGSDPRVEVMHNFKFSKDMGRNYYAWFTERAGDADILHSQNAPLLALLSKNSRVLLHVHNVTRLPYYEVASRNYDRCNYACCSSFIMEELLKNHPSLPPERCSVLLNGIDTGLFSPTEREPNDRPRVLFTGAWIRQKGIHVFLEALRVLEGLGLKFEAKVAGSPFLYDTGEAQDWQSESMRRVSEEISRIRSAMAVRVPSYSQMPQLYGSADIYAFPSVWEEPFGLGVVEAMSCGLPVVASRVGGIPEIVEDGKTGILVEPGSPKALADTIAELIEDERKRRRLAAEGRKRAQERFRIETHARGLLEIYRSMIE